MIHLGPGGTAHRDDADWKASEARNEINQTERWNDSDSRSSNQNWADSKKGNIRHDVHKVKVKRRNPSEEKRDEAKRRKSAEHDSEFRSLYEARHGMKEDD